MALKNLSAMMNTMNGGGDAASEDAKKSTKKKITVEKIYQKKTQLEHILLRPDTYIGSVEPVTELMWIYDDENLMMVQKEITYVPGLYKIFDEILVNAADNKQRDPKMDCIKIDIDAENNTISIWNNGQGIPVVMHKDEKMFVPTMIFGHLLTSSNYNDEEEKVTGGRNGYGAKLCNIFSTKFTVETATKEYKQSFKQIWGNNMTKTSEPKLKDFGGEDYTKITFTPDLSKFRMESLDKDIVDLMSRRAYDIAASTRGVKVFLNEKKVPVKDFKDYVDLYIKDKVDEIGNPLKITYENVNNRWEVAVALSDKGFQQVSFVNSIATTKGGRHIDHAAEAIVKNLIEAIKKKNKGGLTIKPFQVKSHMWIFVNCLIVNPTFDSQTKENMTLQPKNFGSKCTLPAKFITAVILKSGIVESMLLWAKYKEDVQLQKATSGKKVNKLKGIPKLEDANHAGSMKSLGCTLILTEGDSAKTLAVSGLGVVGRDKYGVFPLRGKLLNVREASHKQVLENVEINNIIKIVGLQYFKKYESMDDLKSLRYGRLMIMTDQDQDGSHIKGLLINFIHHNWPTLLKLPFLEEFITPIVKATKNKQEFSFYSLPEFEEWKANKDNWHTYKIKYYKGLGTSTSKEAKEYFLDMKRHRIKFKYGGPNDDSNINMAFSKKCAEQRKEWLTDWMGETKRRRELGLSEQYLYEKETKTVNYSDFVNKELVLFSNCDNERSIPSMVDGLKPGQRKVMFTCMKRNDKREVKVAQLAGSVAEHSAYHHGEQTLMSTIINLAQNYVGSNNINLLQPIGQFGTRLTGGKDAASPRYIFTMLSPLTRYIFHPHDDPLLKNQFDDNVKIEPVWYMPIIPMVLVNGADGIGTGWMTKIPNYNPREIVHNLIKMLDGEEPKPMIPWYKNFKGVIEVFGDTRYIVFGEVALITGKIIEITELPVGTWTQTYKESVLEPMLHPSNDKTTPLITDYKEYNTDITVKFEISMSPDMLAKAEEEGLHKFFKLQTTIHSASMCAFDENGCMQKYDSVNTIFKDFYKLRLTYYEKRKAYLEGILQAEATKLSNQARFIVEKCDGILIVENKKKKDMILELKKSGYEEDPIKAWKIKQDKDALDPDAELEENDDTSSDGESKDVSSPGYDYLLGMTMWNLTKEKKDELLKNRDKKVTEYNILKAKSPPELWREDLSAFMKELDSIEAKERQDESGSSFIKPKLGKKIGVSSKTKTESIAALETQPSPNARRIVPKFDQVLIKKLERAAIVRENKAKKGKIPKVAEEKDEFDAMGETNQKSLKERLGNSPEMIEKKMQAKLKGNLKQTKLNFKSKESPKKKKGKSPWETDSEDSIKLSSDEEFSTPAAQTVRTTARRTAATKVKFTYDSEDEDDEEFELHDNSVGNGDLNTVTVSDLDDDFNPGDGKNDISDTDSEFESRSTSKKQTKLSSGLEASKKKDTQSRTSSDAMFDSLVGEGSGSGQLEKIDDVISVSEDDSPEKKKVPPKKRQLGPKSDGSKPKKITKRLVQKKIYSDSDSDIIETKSKKARKKAGSDSDEEFDLSDFKVSAKPHGTGRVRKLAKYKFDDESDSD